MRALAAAVIRLKCTLHDFLKLLEKKAGSIAAGRKVVKPASDGAEREVLAGYSGPAVDQWPVASGQWSVATDQWQ